MHLSPGTVVSSPEIITTPGVEHYLQAILRGEPTPEGVRLARGEASSKASTFASRRWITFTIKA